jgi:hypothetical protein
MPADRLAFLSGYAPPNNAMVASSQDDGAEPYSGLRADPGAVPGASTLEA